MSVCDKPVYSFKRSPQIRCFYLYLIVNLLNVRLNLYKDTQALHFTPGLPEAAP